MYSDQGTSSRPSSVRLFLVVVFFSLFTFAHAKPTLQDYGALPTTQMMTMSPDGSLIAYRQVSDKHDLAMVYSLSQKKSIAALDLSQIDPRWMYFLNDSKLVLIVSEYRRIRGYRGTMDVSTAFSYDVHSHELNQLLTPGDEIYKGQTGLGQIVGISEDAKYVFMPAFIGRSEYDQSPHRSVMRVDLENPRRPNEYFRGSDESMDFLLDDKGHPLVHEEYDNKDNLHTIKVADGENWKTLYKKKVDIPQVRLEGLSADGKSLVLINEDERTERLNYYLMSINDGTITDANYGRDDADVEHVYQDINRKVYGIRYSGFRPSYTFFDSKLQSLVDQALTAFSGQSVFLRSWTGDKNSILVQVSGASAPEDYYLLQKGKAPQFLVSGRPNIKPDQLHPIGELTVKARDDFEIPTLLTIPRAHLKTMQNLPAIMMPHGGPSSYDRVHFDYLAQALAGQGYLVIQPQFRGSSGFGTAHEKAGWGEWGKGMQDDLTDTLKHLIQKGIVDQSRVCIVGASYGGYAALAGGAFTPDLYKCVVAIAGVSDINRMLKDEKRDHGGDHWVLSYWQLAIANNQVDKEFLASISPENYASSFTAPVLLLHGDRDKIVPYKQSKIMYKALKKAKKPVELIKLKGENHHLISSETRQQALQATIQFINKSLQGKSES